MESLLAPAINFFLLVGFLAYKLKQPLRNFVKQRHDNLKNEILSVADQLKQAQEKYNEFSVKLKSVSAEVATLREQARQDSATMKQKILADARRTATNVVSDSKNIAEGLYQQLQGQLYTELSLQVLNRAETILRERLTGADHARIREEFSRQVERVQ